MFPTFEFVQNILKNRLRIDKSLKLVIIFRTYHKQFNLFVYTNKLLINYYYHSCFNFIIVTILIGPN